MPIFQRYLLKEMLQNALVTFGVITLIMLIGGSLRVLHRSEFLTLNTFLTAVGFFVATKLDLTLPMTVLVSVVSTYGRAAAENEINTLRASGVHLYTAVAPALLLGLLSSLLVLHVSDKVSPRLQFRSSEMLEQGIANYAEALIARGEREIEIDEHTLVLHSGFDEQGNMHNVRLKRYAEEEEGAEAIEHEIRAEIGRFTVDTKLGVLHLHLEGIESLSGSGEGSTAGSMDYPYSFRREAREKKLKHHTLAELVAAESREYKGDPKGREIKTELHRRIAGAFACVLFVLIGVPLAIIFRYGNRMVAFLIAFLIAIVIYYPTILLGENLARKTDLDPALAMWSGSGVLALLGGGLLATVFRR